MRTRVSLAPSGATAFSTDTPETTPLASVMLFITFAASTSRRSTSSVFGSGRFVRYETGSDVSMVTVVMRRPALADSVLSWVVGAVPFGPASMPTASSGVSPAAQSPATTSARMPVKWIMRLLLFAIVRGPESLSHLFLFDQREGIVDFLHDHQTLRGDASDRAVHESIVHVRGESFPGGPRHQRDVRAAALQHAFHHQLGRRQAAQSFDALAGRRFNAARQQTDERIAAVVRIVGIRLAGRWRRRWRDTWLCA